MSDVVFRLGELFSGAGGLALGAVNASVSAGNKIYTIKPVWANDFDADACDTYRDNICPDRPSHAIHKDVRKLSIESLAKIDALAFGFPCNDFSAVGETKGTNGHYGPLYTYGVKALVHFQPKWFLAENVAGLRHANEGKDFKIILNDFYNAGYDIYPHLYRFEKYQVPQSRHRIIITGIRKDLNLSFKVPAPTSNRLITCKDAMENPPIPKDAYNNEISVSNDRVVERLKHIKPGQNAFNADMPDNLRLNIKKTKISQIYKRLDPSKPSYTVTGSGGGGTHVYHWEEHRALTNRERARLQAFPDSFKFSGSRQSVRRQIGMAVPPTISKIICEAILNTFAGIQYKEAKASMPSMVHTKITLDRFDESEKATPKPFNNEDSLMERGVTQDDNRELVPTGTYKSSK